MTASTYLPNELQGLTEEHRRSIMAILIFVGRIDGKWDPREEAIVQPLLKDGAVWGIANDLMANESAQAARVAGSLRSHENLVALGALCAAARPSAAAREKLVRLLLAIGWADDVLHPHERSAIGAFVQGLGVPGPRANEIAVEAEPANERIFSAIVGGRVDVVRQLLDAGTPVMSRDVHQWTPLHLAVSKGQLAIVELLLERGADVHTRHDQGQSPLFVACNKPYGEIVERLLKAGARPDDLNAGGYTALSIAATTGQLGVVRALRKGGASLETLNPGGLTALHFAARAGQSAAVAFLLADGAAASARTTANVTPLMLAAENGDTASVTALLAAHAELEAVDSENRTVLHHAVIGNAPDVVALLIGFGANVDAASTQKVVPLHLAARNGWTSSAKLLLDAGANLDVANIEGGTAIFLATLRDHRATMELLVARGAKVDESKRGAALAIKSLRSVPLTEPLPHAGLRPSDDVLAAWSDYQVAAWLNLEGSTDQVLVSGKDSAGRPSYVGRAKDGDARARYLVVTDKAGKRWLPVFTSDAAANAFRHATPIGWPEGGSGLAKAVTGTIGPSVFAVGDLPVDGVMLDPYGPSAVALSAEDCDRIASRAR